MRAETDLIMSQNTVQYMQCLFRFIACEFNFEKLGQVVQVFHCDVFMYRGLGPVSLWVSLCPLPQLPNMFGDLRSTFIALMIGSYASSAVTFPGIKVTFDHLHHLTLYLAQTIHSSVLILQAGGIIFPECFIDSALWRIIVCCRWSTISVLPSSPSCWFGPPVLALSSSTALSTGLWNPSLAQKTWISRKTDAHTESHAVHISEYASYHR